MTTIYPAFCFGGIEAPLCPPILFISSEFLDEIPKEFLGRFYFAHIAQKRKARTSSCKRPALKMHVGHVGVATKWRRWSDGRKGCDWFTQTLDFLGPANLFSRPFKFLTSATRAQLLSALVRQGQIQNRDRSSVFCAMQSPSTSYLTTKSLRKGLFFSDCLAR